MQPRLQVINRQPAPRQRQDQDMPFSFLGGTGNLEVFEDDVIRASNAARREGLGEREINNTLQEYLSQRAQRAQVQQQQQAQSAGQEESRNGLLDFLLPTLGSTGGVLGGAAAGAAAGSVVPVLGTAVGGVLGGILGGAAGGAGGQVASNKIQGKNFKDRVGSEALFGSLGGAGKLFKLGRGGAKVLNAADDVAGGGDDVARSLGLIDDIGKTDPNDLSKLGKAGKRLRMKASGLDDSRAFDTASKQFGAQDVLESVGLKGSATKKFENADQVLKDLSKQTDNILAKNTNVTPVANVRKTIVDRASGEIVSDRNTFNRSIEEAVGELSKLGGKTGRITAKNASDFKKKLGGRLGSAFKKLQNGTDLTPEQAANMAVWRSLDDVIVGLAPEAKRLTKTQSVLIDALPSLRKASKDAVGVPFTKGLSLETPSKLIQSFQDRAGSLIEKGGRAGVNNINAGGGSRVADVLKQLTAQGGSRALFGQYANPLEIPQQSGLDGLGIGDGIGVADEAAFQEFASKNGIDPVQAASDPELVNQFNQAYISDQMQQQGFITDPELGLMTPGGFNAGMQNAGITPDVLNEAIPREAIIEAIIDDFSTTGGENVDNLINFFEFANQMGGYAPPEASGGAGGLDLNNTAITTIADTQAGLDQLDALANTFEQSSANNPILGRLRGLNPFDTDAQSFDSQLRLTRQIIGKALEGGVLRKEDEVKYTAILPNRGDTDAAALDKISFIKRDIQNKLDRFIQSQQQFNGAGVSSEQDGLAALGLV